MRPEFVYITYIRTTSERLWQALTVPEFTMRWWKTTLTSDWSVGSTVTWDNHGVVIADPDQVVLEADPFRWLAYTWHTFTDEVAETFSFSDEIRSGLSKEPRSKVSFDLEPDGEMVKLTVVHDGFAPGGTVSGMVSQGWPRFLSSLKTMLETGSPLSS